MGYNCYHVLFIGMSRRVDMLLIMPHKEPVERFLETLWTRILKAVILVSVGVMISCLRCVSPGHTF